MSVDCLGSSHLETDLFLRTRHFCVSVGASTYGYSLKLPSNAFTPETSPDEAARVISAHGSQDGDDQHTEQTHTLISDHNKDVNICL